MQRDASQAGLFQRLSGKLAKLAPGLALPEPPIEGPQLDALGTLEELQAGKRPDYCLYLGPTGVKPSKPDLEDMLARAFAPLPCVPVDSYKSPLRRLPTDGRLAEEAFGTLATHARVLLVVPSEKAETITRLRWIREQKHLWRCVFFMPDTDALGTADWSAQWVAAQTAIASVGVDLPPYTAGGWLFRFEVIDGAPPRACTFRMIANPNAEKIAKALEAICGEMSASSDTKG